MEDIFQNTFVPEKYINSSKLLAVTNAKIKEIDEIVKSCEFYYKIIDQNYWSITKENIHVGAGKKIADEFVATVKDFINIAKLEERKFNKISGKLEELEYRKDYDEFIREIRRYINNILDIKDIEDECKIDYKMKRNLLLQQQQKIQSYTININQNGGQNHNLYWSPHQYGPKYSHKYQKYKSKYLALKKIYA
jgi:hypothetical protein